MKYFVSVTDLHSALLDGIRSSGDGVFVEYPMRGSLYSKLKSVPRVGWTLLRAWADRDSHVFVAHPFTSVTAAFTAAAKRLSLFDDGTAYYNNPPLPSGKREALDRWLTRRKFNWRAIDVIPRPTFSDLVANSKAVTFHAIFPSLVNAPNVRVLPVDMTLAFPLFSGQEGPGSDPISLLLDTRDEGLPKAPLESLVRTLADAAELSPSGRMFFRAHPSEESRLTQALRLEPWAVEVTEPLESFIRHTPIGRVYSFFSSGALSVKLTQPSAQVVNIRSRDESVNPGLARLYFHLDAREVVV